MDIKTFISTCLQNPYRIKEIDNTISENLAGIEKWAEANPSIIGLVKSADVNKTLITFVNKLIQSGASMDIVKNVYSEYSVIACILVNQTQIIGNKSQYNKILKLFYQILANSSHFTIMYKKSTMKHARTIKHTPTLPVELFWIIPMFLNPMVFNKFDFKTFDSMISNLVDIAVLNQEFIPGYNAIILGLSMETTDSYREFIRDSIKLTSVEA